MKKLLLGLTIVAVAFGVTPIFAATDDAKHRLDDIKKQAKVDYENQKKELKSQYKGSDLDQKLKQAEADYKNKAKQLDEQKKNGDNAVGAVQDKMGDVQSNSVVNTTNP
jgi:hypothetical protein